MTRWGGSARSDVDGEVLAESAFTGVADQPVLLWDAQLPAAAGDPVEWFSGNEFKAPPPPTEIDVTRSAPLADEDFWPTIDTLGGRMWEKTIESAATLLAKRDEEFIMRWAQTAALKALELSDVLERAAIAAHFELHAIGAVLGKGATCFRHVMGNPEAFDPRWMSDNSPQVIWLGAHALTRRTRVDRLLRTSFTERHHRILKAQRAAVAEYQRINGIAPAPPESSFRATRAVVSGDGELRERLMLIPGDNLALALEDDAARAALTSDGSTLVAGPEFRHRLSVGLWGGTVFSIKRRTSLPVGDYIDRYITRPD